MSATELKPLPGVSPRGEPSARLQLVGLPTCSVPVTAVGKPGQLKASKGGAMWFSGEKAQSIPCAGTQAPCRQTDLNGETPLCCLVHVHHFPDLHVHKWSEISPGHLFTAANHHFLSRLEHHSIASNVLLRYSPRVKHLLGVGNTSEWKLRESRQD